MMMDDDDDDDDDDDNDDDNVEVDSNDIEIWGRQVCVISMHYEWWQILNSNFPYVTFWPFSKSFFCKPHICLHQNDLEKLSRSQPSLFGVGTVWAYFVAKRGLVAGGQENLFYCYQNNENKFR